MKDKINNILTKRLETLNEELERLNKFKFRKHTTGNNIFLIQSKIDEVNFILKQFNNE